MLIAFPTFADGSSGVPGGCSRRFIVTHLISVTCDRQTEWPAFRHKSLLKSNLRRTTQHQPPGAPEEPPINSMAMGNGSSSGASSADRFRRALFDPTLRFAARAPRWRGKGCRAVEERACRPLRRTKGKPLCLRKGGKGIARSRRHSVAHNQNTRLEIVRPALLNTNFSPAQSEAIRLDPENVALVMSRAKVCSTRGRHNQAMVDYAWVLQRRPADPAVYMAPRWGVLFDLQSEAAIAEFHESRSRSIRRPLRPWFRGRRPGTATFSTPGRLTIMPRRSAGPPTIPPRGAHLPGSLPPAPPGLFATVPGPFRRAPWPAS